MSLSPKIQPFSVEPVSDAAPVVVGGVGGSGTRVVAQLLTDAGVQMGGDINKSLDDLTFTVLFKRKRLWPLAEHLDELKLLLQTYLTARGQPTPQGISTHQHIKRSSDVLRDITREGSWMETGTVSDRRLNLLQIPPLPKLWGWKEPNSHVVLPFLLQALPNMKYIHVIRNGLDMACSSNQNQLGLWGALLLGRAVERGSVHDSLAYWCEVHHRLLELRKSFPRQILLLQFETMVRQPSLAIETLSGFLQISITKAAAAQWGATLRTTAPRPADSGRDQLRPSDQQQSILTALGYGLSAR